jgi:hypothetical protein
MNNELRRDYVWYDYVKYKYKLSKECDADDEPRFP